MISNKIAYAVRYTRIRNIDEGVVNRWARKMEDAGTAPNVYIQMIQSVPVYGQNVAPVHYIPVPYSVQARLSVHTEWISCRYIFGAIPSSYILRAHLYTLYNSFIHYSEECSYLALLHKTIFDGKFKDNLPVLCVYTGKLITCFIC